MVFYCLKYLAYVKDSPSYIKYCNVQSIDIVKQLGLIAVFSIINPSFANLDSLPGSSISHLELFYNTKKPSV